MDAHVHGHDEVFLLAGYSFAEITFGKQAPRRCTCFQKNGFLIYWSTLKRALAGVYHFGRLKTQFCEGNERSPLPSQNWMCPGLRSDIQGCSGTIIT